MSNFDKGMDAYNSGNYALAIDYLKKAAIEDEHINAFHNVGYMYQGSALRVK